MIGMARTRECGPLKMLRTYIGKSSRLFIFGLVIQDHIESIGKPILLKGDEVLIMIYLLKCLVILLQNPQPLSLSISVQNPQSQLGSTEYIHPGPPSSPRQGHSLNPNKLDPPIWILVSPRWVTIFLMPGCNFFGPTKIALGN